MPDEISLRCLPQPQREGPGGGAPAGGAVVGDGNTSKDEGTRMKDETALHPSSFIIHPFPTVLCISAHAFGSDWAQLESGMFRFRDPLNKERRFLTLRLDDAPIKGSLAQFLYIKRRPVNRSGTRSAES